MVRRFRVKIEGKTYEVEVEEITGTANMRSDSQTLEKAKEENKPKVTEQVYEKKDEKERVIEKTETLKDEKKIEIAGDTEGLKVVTAPMSGMIVSVEVEEGVKVSPGQTLLILEAMKMENSIISEYSGIVKEVFVKKGENVETGQKLLTIKSS